MNKEILIEIFKDKLIHCNYSDLSGFSYLCYINFHYNNDLVDIRIREEDNRFYIQYELVKFEIEKEEYDELFCLFDEKLNEFKKIEEEEKKIKYNKNTESILEMYQKIITQKREVLTEKQNKKK